MQDQENMWDKAHANHRLKSDSKTQTSFAEEVNKAIPNNSKILELGCGEGNDSIYFAQQGHKITATDFSKNVISRNINELSHSDLQFKVLDINNNFTYQDKSFDVVYARLSLHYFNRTDTDNIFKEIARVLSDDGYLCFMCKSVDDNLYGQGKKIEDDMFELNGHVRHFFSENYSRSILLKNGFEIKMLEKGEDRLYERDSAFIKVIAQKA